MLAASIVQTSVPANITDLTVEQYVELRSDYADIRETFREYIVETVQKEQLKDIGDKEQLESIINKLSNNFNSKICKIKELNKYRIPEWVDIGIGVASLVGNFSDDPIPKAIGTSSVLVQPFLRGQIEKRVVGGHDIHHTFANLQSDIDWQYTVRRLLQAGWF
ncbi:hypothetical protein ABH15_07475 [Methanoculleus taiwanensis]|uniref:Uncharacterized protein n=2 Tax=Methanoculleus taiwanensis TaxID=1550565 RepID=A0A498H083_9EURY|nr:hypothetical protein ABH15_07475 [Methanoculleus taiwanensis]